MPDFQVHIREATIEDAKDIAFVRLVVRTERQGVPWNMIPEDRRADALDQEIMLQEYGFLSPAPPPFSRMEFLLVAEDASRGIVGYVCAGPAEDSTFPRGGLRFYESPYEGQLHLLCVLPDAQRHGVGRALVRAAAERLQAQDKLSLLVYAEKPIQTYYERTLKGTFVGEGPGVREPTRIYRWDNLSRLIRACVWQ
jgi:ribosomal protein S18 acetylase RimI-like enzyme